MKSPSRGNPREQTDLSSFGARLLDMFGRSIGVAILIVLAMAWLSLLTWSATDPSPTHATAGAPHNALGATGAALSDVLLQSIGLAALAALFAPMLWAFELISQHRVARFKSKVFFYIASLLLLSGAFSALPVVSSWPFRHDLGGVFGDGVFALALSLFALGSVGGSGWLVGLVLFGAGLSALCYSIGVKVVEAIGLIRLHLHELISKTSWSSFGLSQGFGGVTQEFARRWRTFAPATLAAPGVGAGNVATGPSVAREIHGWSAKPDVEAQRAPVFGGAVEADRDRQKPAMTFAPVLPDPPQAPAPHDLAFDDEPERESGFDMMTDESSRKIAQRFAPGSRVDPTRVDASMPQRETIQHELPFGRRPERNAQAAPRPVPHRVKSATDPGKRPNGSRGPAKPGYQLPSLELLKRDAAPAQRPDLTQEALAQSAQLLSDTLADFGVKGEMRAIRPGPVVTLYEFEPARGTKSSRVIGLAEDIARSMGAMSARVAVIPGRNAMGIELPNATREPVGLRSVVGADAFLRSGGGTLPLALGKSISGEPVVADLARMPHLLVAGTTGSGKSVGVNAMILSLLYRYAPEHCRLLMIDPKMLELSTYEGIPHLLCPVITEPGKAVSALDWVVREMEERYKSMSKLAVRNVDGFNERVRDAKKRGEVLARRVQTGIDADTGQPLFEQERLEFEPMPYIVVVIDEFADLMMTAGKEVEAAVLRLAQKARAAGIHLIMATQRPSVDIITGTIKANFPTRISFKVASKVDSRTILNEQGAEQLLGQGDMLYSSGAGQAVRVHGAFVSDEEVEAIANSLRAQAQPHYLTGITETAENGGGAAGAAGNEMGNDLYPRAFDIVVSDQKASTSYLQRRLSIGYNRAADLIERLEANGVVSPANSSGKRQVLLPIGSGMGGEGRKS